MNPVVQEELLRQTLYWQEQAARWQRSSAWATWCYGVLVLISLGYIFYQLVEARKTREHAEKTQRFKATLQVFDELYAEEVSDTRRYIYNDLPDNLDGLRHRTMKRYFEKCETALMAFDRVGFLIQKGYIDHRPILGHSWTMVWRCWQRTEELVLWARESRDDDQYLAHFEYLFTLSDAYRLEEGRNEPRIY